MMRGMSSRTKREHGTDKGLRQHYAFNEILCAECEEFWGNRWEASREIDNLDREMKRYEREERARWRSEGRLDVLVGAALRKLRAAEGEWVAWRTIRPPYRDRPLYDEAVWDQITKSLVVESHEILHGKTVRRQAKFVGPL